MRNLCFFNQLRWLQLVIPCVLSACAIKPLPLTQAQAKTQEQVIEEPFPTRLSPQSSVKTIRPQPASSSTNEAFHPSIPHSETTNTFKREEDANQSTEDNDIKDYEIVNNGSVTSPSDSGDLWQRLRYGLTIPSHLNQPEVQSYLTWYRQHPKYIQRITSRAKFFLYFVLEAIESRGLPAELALLPAVESAYKPTAHSRRGAVGLWQFTPETGHLYELEQNWWYDGRLDICASTHAALNYLADLNRLFEGNWLLTLAAYNAGPKRVIRAISQNSHQDQPTDFWDLRLPKETRHYVPKLLALKSIIANPQKYGLTLPQLANKPVFTQLETKTQINFGLASRLADVELDELYLFNSGFKRWASNPSGPHRLVLPIGKQAQFKQKLAKLSNNQRKIWLRYPIREGDNLSSIAHQFQTTVTILKQANKLHTHRIIANTHLLVPQPMSTLVKNSYATTNRLDSLDANMERMYRIHHIVKAGESLFTISRRFSVTVKDIAMWNRISARDTLKKGDKLVILRQSSVPTQESRTSTIPTPNPATNIRAIRYLVKQGDTLSRIAKRFRVQVSDLQQWNEVPDNHVLLPDQSLMVHVE
jgi:membrane-bound lytic murein transglycosylase D